MSSKNCPLAIVGMSCLFPKADDLQGYWANIKNGVDAITPVPVGTHWNAADYFDADPKKPDHTYAQRGGFLSPFHFNPMEFGMAPKDIEATDTSQLLAMVAAQKALADAGYAAGGGAPGKGGASGARETGSSPWRDFNRDRTSVILGVTGALELVIPLGARLGHPQWRKALKDAGIEHDIAEDVVQRISDSYVGWQENSFPGLLGNVAAGRIASRLDLGGTNCVVDAACASSLAAIHLAGLELAAGLSDMVITGGVDTFNDIFMYMCFSKTPALSPTGDAKPFDADCDGTVLGEGLGMLVLKRLADAERDGDRIYAVLKGIGSSSDGRSSAIYAPRAGGQKLALQRAYAAAGVTPQSIDLIEAHGTGTKVGDATELSALAEVFSGEADDPASPIAAAAWCALGSVKSQIGHTKAAAGVAGIIKAALALHHKVLPPTIKVKQPLEGALRADSPFYVNTKKRPWIAAAGHPRRAGVSALGFGGTNFHCVLEEHAAAKSAPDWDGDVELFALCADSTDALLAQLAQQQAALATGAAAAGSASSAGVVSASGTTWLDFRRAAYASRLQFRGDAQCRLLIVITSQSDRAAQFSAARTLLEKNAGKTAWTAPSGIAFGSGPVQGQLGALFPGQGSQYPGMLRDLACQFPEMLDALAQANAAFAQAGAQAAPGAVSATPAPAVARLSDLMYPPPAFSDSARIAQEDALKATQVAQPALGAVSLGASRVLAQFGVHPQAVCGHSYGELSALRASGRITPDALHQLSNLRGRLMAQRADGPDRGAMLAVQVAAPTLQEFLKTDGGDLVIANRNSPKQTVLAGSRAAIERAAAALTARSIRNRVLQVSAAFHSPLVADARAPFAAALDAISIDSGTLPVYANASGSVYPQDAGEARALLAGQIVQPVQFIAQIEAMHAAGVRTFIEIGPGHVLSDLVQAILPAGAAETIALDASGGARSGIFDLALALARLAALGHPVDLARWEHAPAPLEARSGKPALTVAISGANYRAPHAARPPAPPRPARAQAAVQPSVARGHAAMTTPSPAHAAPLLAPAQTPAATDVPAALRAAQDGILALQRLQEQTAQLHKQFLEGQESARRAITALLGAYGGAPAHPVQSTAVQQAAVQHSAVSASAAVAMPAAYVPVAPVASAPAMTAAPAATVASPTSIPFAAKPAADRSGIEQAVLEVVADKTGYPVEMLNLGMGMDADLGIDSIKRVEIMAALRGRLPQAPEIKPEHLGALQTLEQVVAFLAAGSATTSAAVAPPVAAAEPATAPGAASPAADAAAHIAQVLLGVVAEKTGYPPEMLELGMGLDADLGIDSIKRVEIMAALRTQLPGAPEIKPEHLGSLQTLQQIVDFLNAGAAIAMTASAPATHSGVPQMAAAAQALSTAAVVPGADIAQVLLAVVAEKTGYPVDMLNLDMGLDADLGIDSIKRVEIMAALRSQLPASPEIKPEHLGSLQTLQQMVDFLAGPSSAAASATAPTMAPAATPTLASVELKAAADAAPDAVAGVLGGVMRQVVRPVVISPHEHRASLALASGAQVWLVDDGTPLAQRIETLLKAKRLTVQRGNIDHKFTGARAGKPSALLVLAPASGCDANFLQRTLALMQQASPGLRKAAAGGESAALLVTVSRLDGRFGFGGMTGRADPVSGGLAGLVKTARLEWPGVHCKALDLDPVSLQAEDAARQIVDEMFLAGPVEVGLSADAPHGLEVELEPLSESVNTASRGDLADVNAASLPLSAHDVVVVTGGARGVTGDAAVAMARRFGSTFVLLGRSVLDAAEPAWAQGIEGEAALKKALFAQLPRGTTPGEVETQFRRLMAQREIRTLLARIEATGARAEYCAVDVRDAAAVARAVADIRTRHGAIHALVHGAGVLADRRIEDKTAEQFAAVYDTKVSGLAHLLVALGDDALKVVALFASYTGRFGRVGQVDYAAANEVLNKVAQREARLRPACRVVSINWGPWNGGMVTPGLRKLFEAEGVGLIEPAAGAQFLVDEICARRAAQVGTAGSAGPGHGDVEVLAIAPSAQQLPQVLVPQTAAVPVSVSALAASLHANVAFEREVSVAALPFLESHVINGRAVLPAALMVEWLAQAALHGNPGMRFHGLDDFKVLKGVVLDAGQTVTVSLRAGAGTLRDKLHVVPVQMTSEAHGRALLHAQADVLLSEEKLPPAPIAKKFDMQGGAIADAYSLGVLFHGVALHGIETVEVCAEKGVAALLKAASAPIKWMRNPLRGSWIADPLALDSAFQMMILWSNAHRGGPSLPSALGRYRQFVGAFPKGGCRAVIGVAIGISAIAVATIQFLDRQGNLLASAEGCEFVVDAALHDAFRQNRLKLDT